MMMMKLVVSLCLWSTVSGFVGVNTHILRRPSIHLKANNNNMDSEKLQRAVECAENYGLCDVDELTQLANGRCSFSLVVNARV